MSQTITAVFIQFAIIFLPMLGLKVGSDQLTITIQTIVVILSGLWIWIRRVRQGDVGVFGGRK